MYRVMNVMSCTVSATETSNSAHVLHNSPQHLGSHVYRQLMRQNPKARVKDGSAKNQRQAKLRMMSPHLSQCRTQMMLCHLVARLLEPPHLHRFSHLATLYRVVHTCSCTKEEAGKHLHTSTSRTQTWAGDFNTLASSLCAQAECTAGCVS